MNDARHTPEARAINAAVSGLDGSQVRELMRQLRAILDALPADDKNDNDIRLRHDIDILLAGYSIGAGI